MKAIPSVLLLTALSISCAEKKDESESTVISATLPDGTEVQLDQSRLYAESTCEVDNVINGTYRKTWYSISDDKLTIWSLVFLNDACDVTQDYVVFESPISLSLAGFDGSTATVDVDDDQTPDFDILVSDTQLSVQPRFEDAEDQTYDKSEAVFSIDRIFDFSLEMEPPTVTTDNLEVNFTVDLLTDDFLVADASYLKSVYASISCVLANGVTVRPTLPGQTRENKLDGAGSYTASVALILNQKGLAAKSCEVYLDRIYEKTANGSLGVEIKSAQVTIE
ncbi:hypothetical protein [Oligoflexus tunisiensis]|uniref:hypothetical protein n=1 Tax=Oligoflexus tunisiensis TaxID=708132 RepID=UPI00114D0D3F|nr:hypothetical protein [Oligoflexus tunisiensis]